MKKQQEWHSHHRHQHNTDNGGQAMGEELRHVQMRQAYRWRKRAVINVMSQSNAFLLFWF